MERPKANESSAGTSEFLEFFEQDELAAETCQNKYALRDNTGALIETSPVQIIERVARQLAAHTESPETSYETFVRAIDRFRGVCPQGSVLSALGDELYIQSLSNCFVIPAPHDSIAGILKTAEEEAQILKKRGGVGIDLSTLRPYGSFVGNAARSSTGVYGFMDLFSNVCRAIGQGGRRGALMLSLDVRHPDVIRFAEAKNDLRYCTGANVSVRVSDEFMEAVLGDQDFELRWPVDADDPELVRVIPARLIWKAISASAHRSAEPGVLMWDNITKNLPAHSYSEFETVGVNPCSEIPLSAYDSCRLISICLPRYVESGFSSQAAFDFEKFAQEVRIAVRMQEALVEAEITQVDKILSKLDSGPSELTARERTVWEAVRTAALRGRRIGLGTHGLADCLAQLCIRYDSEGAIAVVDQIYKFFRDTAYDESVLIAQEQGPFPAFDWKVEKDCAFIQRLPKDLQKRLARYGRRHVSLLTMAPTGSISILSRVSSGIEPVFRYDYKRRRRVNFDDLEARVDYVDALGERWQEYRVVHPNVLRYLESAGRTKEARLWEQQGVPCSLPEFFVTAGEISWERRVELQGTIQQYLDHGISSTINLPEDTELSTVQELYLAAWRRGLKGITVYREGSRSGVLLAGDPAAHQSDSPLIQRSPAPKRPAELPAEIHVVKAEGSDIVVVVGLLEGMVYEVFVGSGVKHDWPAVRQSGKVIKRSRGLYQLRYEYDGDERIVNDPELFGESSQSGFARLLSTALRHGTPLEFVVRQLEKASGSVVSLEAVTARVLREYIPFEAFQDYQRCSRCGSFDQRVLYESGCLVIRCEDCGQTDRQCL